jgi:hypothetical protein
MPAAWISAGVGLYSAVKGGKDKSKAADAADPFASERGAYQDDLRSLMTGAFKPSDPSYQWRFNQGMEGVNRGAAASGLLRSGNRLAALEDYGQGQASTEYANQFSRLSQLAGANIGSPAAAAQIIQKDSANSAAYTQQLAEKAAPYIQNWWQGLNSGSSTPPPDGGNTPLWV